MPEFNKTNSHFIQLVLDYCNSTDEQRVELESELTAYVKNEKIKISRNDNSLLKKSGIEIYGNSNGSFTVKSGERFSVVSDSGVKSYGPEDLRLLSGKQNTLEDMQKKFEGVLNVRDFHTLHSWAEVKNSNKKNQFPLPHDFIMKAFPLENIAGETHEEKFVNSKKQKFVFRNEFAFKEFAASFLRNRANYDVIKENILLLDNADSRRAFANACKVFGVFDNNPKIREQGLELIAKVLEEKGEPFISKHFVNLPRKTMFQSKGCIDFFIANMNDKKLTPGLTAYIFENYGYIKFSYDKQLGKLESHIKNYEREKSNAVEELKKPTDSIRQTLSKTKHLNYYLNAQLNLFLNNKETLGDFNIEHIKRHIKAHRQSYDLIDKELATEVNKFAFYYTKDAIKDMASVFKEAVVRTKKCAKENTPVKDFAMVEDEHTGRFTYEWGAITKPVTYTSGNLDGSCYYFGGAGGAALEGSILNAEMCTLIAKDNGVPIGSSCAILNKRDGEFLFDNFEVPAGYSDNEQRELDEMFVRAAKNEIAALAKQGDLITRLGVGLGANKMEKILVEKYGELDKDKFLKSTHFRSAMTPRRVLRLAKYTGQLLVRTLPITFANAPVLAVAGVAMLNKGVRKQAFKYARTHLKIAAALATILMGYSGDAKNAQVLLWEGDPKTLIGQQQPALRMGECL